MYYHKKIPVKINFYNHTGAVYNTTQPKALQKLKVTVLGIHKRMVRFQKLLKNLFLNLHGHNIHC
jgi:hypothetical protein